MMFPLMPGGWTNSFSTLMTNLLPEETPSEANRVTCLHLPSVALSASHHSRCLTATCTSVLPRRARVESLGIWKGPPPSRPELTLEGWAEAGVEDF